jgi:acetyl-CoA acetyltransferase family protein
MSDATSTSAYVLDAVRTPFGRFGGALAGVRPDDLAASTLTALLERTPDLDPARIDDVVLGAANQAGEDNRDVARMAVLLAGLPTSVPGVTVNRLCGSSLEATIQGARAIESGDAEVVVAGGAESMSRAPWVLQKPSRPYPAGHETLHSTTLGWRMVNPAMPAEWTISLGESTEKLAGIHGVTREEQDAFAWASHQRAAKAWADGVFADEIVQVPGAELDRDEAIRETTTLEKLGTLKPAFRADGTVTPGNASPLNDGASMVLLGTEAAAGRIGRDPLARVVSRAAHGNDPDVFGYAPVEAANEALRRAGIGWSALSAVELNEAFAAQSLACLKGWPALDPSILNVHGGAIAIGHPLGASGGRIVGRLARALHAQGGGWGLAAICIGVGQGLAVVLHA